MEKIALELWNSEYDVKGSIMETCSAMKIFFYNTINKPKDVVNDYIFYNWKHRALGELSHHLYQLNVWKKSMKAKIITETIFYAIIVCIFQYYLSAAVTSGHKL